MPKQEDQQPDGDKPFGSSRADWAIPGVDRSPVEPVEPVEPVDPSGAAGTVSPAPASAARPRRRLMLPPSDDLPRRAPGEEVPELVAGLELAGEAVRLIQSGSMAGVSAGEKRAAVEAAARLKARMDAAYLMLLGQLDADPEAVPSATRHVGCTFLKHRLLYGAAEAARDVAAARALFGDEAGLPLVGAGLPLVGAALAAGQITRSHADVAVKCLTRIPRHLRDKVDDDGVTGAAKVDEYLTEQSQQFAPSTTELLARQVLAMLDPDGADRYDEKAYERRSFTYRTDATGMLVGKFQLAPAEGAIVRAAIETMVKTSKARVEGETADGQTVLFGDERTLTQQSADAVTAICTAWLRGGTGHTPTTGEGCRCGGTSKVGAPLTRVLVVATPEQVAAARAAIPTPRDRNGEMVRPPGTTPPGTTPRGTAPRGTAPPGTRAGLATEVASGPLPPGAFGRLLCDAVEQAVLIDENRRVLYLGADHTPGLSSATDGAHRRPLRNTLPDQEAAARNLGQSLGAGRQGSLDLPAA